MVEVIGIDRLADTYIKRTHTLFDSTRFPRGRML